MTAISDGLEVAQLGNPVLRAISQPVYNIQDPAFQHFLDQLLTTMLAGNGVGIAAPQVGRSLQVLVVASRPNLRYPHAPQMDPVVMINPHLISHSTETVLDWEGCLSVPGLRGQVPRYRAIEVSYITRDGQLERHELTDFVARIFQHELDHLSGTVFLDRMERIQDLVTEQEYLKRVM